VHTEKDYLKKSFASEVFRENSSQTPPICK